MASGHPSESWEVTVARLAASNPRHKALIAVVPVAGLALGLAAKAKQTIVFAESGLGTEGQQTQAAINAFMKANPNITVKIDVLSPDSTTYLSQLYRSLSTPSSLERRRRTCSKLMSPIRRSSRRPAGC